MRLKRKKGFTLIELLAVIIVLAIILAIIIPGVLNYITNSKNSAFKSNVLMIIKSIESMREINEIDLTTLNVDEMETELGIVNYNFNQLSVDLEEDKVYVFVEGKNKWEGLAAYGTIDDLVILNDPTFMYDIEQIAYEYENAANLLALTDYDDGYGEINTEFGIKIGDQVYSKIFAGTNGYLVFDNNYATMWNNRDMHNDNIYTPTISLYWTDLIFKPSLIPGSGIYYDVGIDENKNYLLIEYRNVLHYGSSSQMQNAGSFQIKIYEDGTIKMFYKDVFFSNSNDSYGINATVGVYVNQTNYKQYSYEEPIIENNLALKFYLKARFIQPTRLALAPESCFNVESQTKTIISYNSEDADGVACPKSFKIPNKINGVEIKIIGIFAFTNNYLENVTIPNGVTTITAHAFSANQLKSVTIPNSVTTIGELAFAFNELRNITIPTGITKIEMATFLYNNLTSITIPSNVAIIEREAFNYNNLATLTLSEGLTIIGEYAFAVNHLRNLTIPNGVITIGNSAFNDNLLQSVTIPNSVTTIGLYAFHFNYILQGNAIIDNSPGNITIFDSFRNNGPSQSETIFPVFLR